MARYTYTPFPSTRSIRLIKFLLGTKPTCQMLTFELGKAPAYAALSYTWGDNNLCKMICVDDLEMPVTKNLGEAIDAIFTYARDGDMMLWADSICINQEDVQERSSQVRLMNTIYRSAERVAIWLGPAYEDSDLAFDMMKEWKIKFDELKQEWGSEATVINAISSDDPFFSEADGPESQRAVKAFRRVCSRQWWSRAWIVQEATVNSPLKTILFCGNRRSDWACLRASLRLTYNLGLFPTTSDDSPPQWILASHLDEFRHDMEHHGRLPLLRVLRFLAPYDCKDPRDKVYATLGMATDIEEGDIIPDYKKHPSLVYREVVEFYISKSKEQRMDFLGEVWREVPGTQFDLQHIKTVTVPSWVPEWNFTGLVHPLEKRLDDGENAYSASGALDGDCYLSGDHLFLQGSVLDQITRVSNICEWNIANNGLQTERSWIPENSYDAYFNGQTVLEAFNHTIVADMGRKSLDNGLSRNFAVDWDLVNQHRSAMAPEGRVKHSLMCIDIKMMTFGRRFFETSRGFIGLAPAAACIDDQICILLGGQVLYTLRASGNDQYEFIGECYVHGMMDGQACEDPRFSVQRIVLV